MKIIHVVGARPNFMKIAPIMEAIEAHNGACEQSKHIEQILVHTGQHYDERLSKLFFEDLAIPKPEINLEVGSSSHAEQTAEIMKGFEKICLKMQPTHVLVVGDVNSTIACALVASKLGIKVVHVEAGLRSFDRSMPEEINRILTDAISDLLFVTEESGRENLRKEGIPEEKIHFVGNVMIDTLLKQREKAAQSDILYRLGLADANATGQGISADIRNSIRPYAVLTLHRPSNVDDKRAFQNILEALLSVSEKLPVVFPIHPRTLNRVGEFGFGRFFRSLPAAREGRVLERGGIYGVDPLGYLDF